MKLYSRLVGLLLAGALSFCAPAVLAVPGVPAPTTIDISKGDVTLTAKDALFEGSTSPVALNPDGYILTGDATGKTVTITGLSVPLELSATNLLLKNVSSSNALSIATGVKTTIENPKLTGALTVSPGAELTLTDALLTGTLAVGGKANISPLSQNGVSILTPSGVALSGAGSLTLPTGSLSTGTLTLSDAASLTLSTGTLSAGTLTMSGTGDLSLSNALTLTKTLDTTGSTGGTLRALSLTGGSVNALGATGVQIQGDLAASNLALSGAGAFQVGGNLTATALTANKPLTVLGSLSAGTLSSAALLDVRGNLSVSGASDVSLTGETRVGGSLSAPNASLKATGKLTAGSLTAEAVTLSGTGNTITGTVLGTGGVQLNGTTTAGKLSVGLSMATMELNANTTAGAVSGGKVVSKNGATLLLGGVPALISQSNNGVFYRLTLSLTPNTPILLYSDSNQASASGVSDASGKVTFAISAGQRTLTANYSGKSKVNTVNLTGDATLNLELPQGTGTPSDPYLLRETSDFAYLSANPGKVYRLENNLTVTQVLSDSFSGTLDGNGKTLTLNLSAQSGTDTGLMRVLTSSANVRNLTLNGWINSAARAGGTVLNTGSVGSVAGVNQGRIEKVTNNASINGTNAMYAGGVAGYNQGTLYDCRSTTTPIGATQNAVLSTGGTITQPSTGGGGGGGGGNGGGGKPSFDPDAFWDDVIDDINHSKSGDKVRVSMGEAENIPMRVLRELKGLNVTLQISDGAKKITINGKNMYPISPNQVFYTFENLREEYEVQPTQKPKPTARPTQRPTPQPTAAPTAAPVVPVVPAPVVPAPVVSVPTASAPPPAVSVPEVSEAPGDGSSSDIESSSEVELIPEEDLPETTPAAKPQEPKRSILPLVISAAVVLLILAGGGAALYFYQHRRDSIDPLSYSEEEEEENEEEPLE